MGGEEAKMDVRNKSWRRLSVRQWAEILGIPYPSIRHARNLGQFPGSGLQHGLGLASARVARTRGASLEQAFNLAGYIYGLSVADIEGRFAAGATHVLMLGEKVMCRLVPPEAVLNNPVVMEHLPLAWQQGLTPVLLNIEAIWKAILEAVAKLDAPAGQTCGQAARTQ
jgi:hypothetical protein